MCCRFGDTGQGALTIGQGVYGLRRAFLVAGAETLVTSLWRIDDQATGELMLSYYQKLLDKVQPRIGWGHAGGDAGSSSSSRACSSCVLGRVSGNRHGWAAALDTYAVKQGAEIALASIVAERNEAQTGVSRQVASSNGRKIPAQQTSSAVMTLWSMIRLALSDPESTLEGVAYNGSNRLSMSGNQSTSRFV